MLMGAGVDGVIVIATLRCEVPVLRSPGARATRRVWDVHQRRWRLSDTAGRRTDWRLRTCALLLARLPLMDSG